MLITPRQEDIDAISLFFQVKTAILAGRHWFGCACEWVRDLPSNQSKRKLWERFPKEEMFFVCCQQALEKDWYFSYLFWQKAELPTQQLQLQSNAWKLFSFVRSKANSKERLQTVYCFCTMPQLQQTEQWLLKFLKDHEVSTLWELRHPKYQI